MGEELLNNAEKVIEDQMRRLYDLRAKLAAADDSIIFTKNDYLELLDAYIGCEERLHSTLHNLRELGAF